jgi:hypothetical protein
VERKEAPFLLTGFLAAIVVGGILARRVRIAAVLFVHGLTAISSLVLAAKFIPNDGYWFTVIGRDGAVIFIAIVYLLGQLAVRAIVRTVGKGVS